MIAAIQNDQQDGQQRVQVEDWSKRSSVQFTLQASILNDRDVTVLTSSDIFSHLSLSV